MDEPPVGEIEGRLRRRRWTLGCALIGLTVLLGLALVAKLLFLRWVVFTDQSMYPGVAQASTVLGVTRGRPEVGDLVLFQQEEMDLMRRVVAGPGSTVRQTSRGLLVDGQLLPRRPVDTHTYYLRHLSGGSAMALTCNQVLEQIGGREIGLCVDEQSERDRDPIQLDEDEVYVRCDNRSFCAGREPSEGRLGLTEVQAIGYWLMSTRDDSDQPFYKRWFGRFERVP